MRPGRGPRRRAARVRARRGHNPDQARALRRLERARPALLAGLPPGPRSPCVRALQPPCRLPRPTRERPGLPRARRRADRGDPRLPRGARRRRQRPEHGGRLARALRTRRRAGRPRGRRRRRHRHLGSSPRRRARGARRALGDRRRARLRARPGAVGAPAHAAAPRRAAPGRDGRGDRDRPRDGGRGVQRPRLRRVLGAVDDHHEQLAGLPVPGDRRLHRRPRDGVRADRTSTPPG